ncbi:MAG: CocE/NonD family hydrolase [Armatimonadetes bacterium]|nr:CocE/NonD family hydrolase [Armatimonadota bacterium]
MLVYSSAKLESDVIVAGPISLHITASTSAKDTDWYAYVSDVLPNGKSLALVQGIIRARFRKSFEKPELLTPNETAEYEIDLWSLGHVFQKGHRLRVVITSSCFPIYDRNLNTGEDIATGTRMVKAKQTLFHEMGKESYLTFHVLPK